MKAKGPDLKQEMDVSMTSGIPAVYLGSERSSTAYFEWFHFGKREIQKRGCGLAVVLSCHNYKVYDRPVR